MADDNYIIDQPVPVNQDFKALKELGLEFIRDHSGNEWTNLNASDPGVTILEQLCYALTELGYCNDFSVGDILAEPNGGLKTEDKFYQPERILTTSPVTMDDYRKYIIDAVDEVDNAILIPLTMSGDILNRYQCLLLLNEEVNTDQEEDICLAVKYLLNKCRNLNELFADVKVIVNKTFYVKGEIEIGTVNNPADTFRSIREQVRNYIFPNVTGSCYNSPYNNNLQENDFFDGPLLKKGWIPTGLLGEKKDLLRLPDLINIVRSVEGVRTVSISGFVEAATGAELNECTSIGPGEIITIDIAGSVTGSLLAIIEEDSGVISLDSQAQPIGMDTVQTALPLFTYRDIKKYYSIQNTFPEIYAVGANAITANATDYQIAKSRQLKGYLTLFDQVLANQFSQLANIGKLFSFKNSVSGASFEPGHPAALHNNAKSNQPEYPAPYLSFPITYFYQPLYDIPNIKPLLKDNDIFMFSTNIEPKKVQEKKSWEDYKKDPYNPYVRGLMESMEDETTSLHRRNHILDQLLARHGESPLLINSLIEGSKYAGSRLADQVVFKSLYLQNLGLLSYYRMKAHNFLGAQKISGVTSEIPTDFITRYPGSYDHNFIFNSAWVDETEKLKEQDFINFSTAELKLSLLFGLKPLYRDFIINNISLPETATQIRQAFWMIEERRGLILIETALLLDSSDCETVINTEGYPAITNNNIIIVLPDFIDPLQSRIFKRKMDLFLHHTLPAASTYDVCFASSDMLHVLIPVFTDWHNALLYRETKKEGEAKKQKEQKQREALKGFAENLIKLITAIKLPQ